MKNTVTDIYLLTCTFTNWLSRSKRTMWRSDCDVSIRRWQKQPDHFIDTCSRLRRWSFTVRKPLQQRVSVRFCSASVVQVGDCSFLFDSKVFTAGNHEAVKWNTQPTAAEETLWASQRYYAHICIQIHMMKSGLGLLPGAETALYRAL